MTMDRETLFVIRAMFSLNSREKLALWRFYPELNIIPDMLNQFYNYYYQINSDLVLPSNLKCLRLLLCSTVQ